MVFFHIIAAFLVLPLLTNALRNISFASNDTALVYEPTGAWSAVIPCVACFLIYFTGRIGPLGRVQHGKSTQVSGFHTHWHLVDRQAGGQWTSDPTSSVSLTFIGYVPAYLCFKCLDFPKELLFMCTDFGMMPPIPFIPSQSTTTSLCNWVTKQIPIPKAVIPSIQRLD
jgi:hypothetical protein